MGRVTQSPLKQFVLQVAYLNAAQRSFARNFIGRVPDLLGACAVRASSALERVVGGVLHCFFCRILAGTKRVNDHTVESRVF